MTASQDGRVGSRWLWPAVIGVLAITAIVLTIVVALRQEAFSRIASAEAASYTAAPEPAASPVVAYIGDSYSAGVGASSVSKRWVTLVSEVEKWQWENDALGGTGYLATSGTAGCGLAFCANYDGVVKEVAAQKPNIVVVSGGRNDANYSVTQVKTAIVRFFSDLRAALPHATIYVTSPIWSASGQPAELSEIAAQVRASSSAAGATYLDIGEPLAGHENWTAADHIHPNDQGHAAIAAAVEAQLRRLQG